MNSGMKTLTVVVLLAAVAFAGLTAQGLPGGPDGAASSSADNGASSGTADSSGSTEADIFDTSAFDNTVKQSQTQEKKDALSYLVGGTLLVDAQVGTPSSFDGYSTNATFSGKAFAKLSIPTYGQLYLAYDLQHTLLQGAGGSQSATPFGSDLFSNTYSLSEFFFDFDLAKRLFVRVGNQLVAWGPSNVWTPVDFINTTKASSLQSIDLRQGKPGVKLFLPFPSWDVTLFTDFSRSIQDGMVGDIVESTNLAARLAATLGGFELGLSTYLGQGIQNRYGFDFSGSLLGAAIYGELALLFPYGSYDLSYSGSLGLSRSFGELKRWGTQAEFFYNSAGTDVISDYPTMIPTGSFVPLYVGKTYGYAAITKQQFLASFFDLTLSGISNFSDGSYRGKIGAKFSIPGVVPFTTSLSYAGGGADKELTYFSGNNALTLDLQVLVQF